MEDPYGSKLLEILLINAMFALDNSLIMVAAANHLSKKKALIAIIIGILAAVGLRYGFASEVLIIFKQVIPIYLLGGLILAWMIRSLLQEDSHAAKESESLVRVLVWIIFTDFAMSIDSSIYNFSKANGDAMLLSIGVLCNIPLMFLFAFCGGKLLKRYPKLIYIVAGTLAYAAGEMIVGEAMLHQYLLNQGINIASVETYMPWLGPICVIVYWLRCDNSVTRVLDTITHTISNIIKLAVRVIYINRLTERFNNES